MKWREENKGLRPMKAGPIMGASLATRGMQHLKSSCCSSQ